MLKTCSKCKTEKPESDFSPWKKSKDGLFCWCKRCNTDYTMARYYAKTPEERKVRKFNRDNKRRLGNETYYRHKQRYLARMSSKLYGITPEEYLERRSRVCEICGVYREPGKRGSGMHIDHDHATNQLRGTLCDKCNRGLGLFDDSADRLRAAAAYVEKWQK